MDFLINKILLGAVFDTLLLRLKLLEILLLKPAHFLFDKLVLLLHVAMVVKIGFLKQDFLFQSLVLFFVLHLAELFSLLELCLLALLPPLVVEVVVSLLIELVFDALNSFLLDGIEAPATLFKLLLLELFPALSS